jgi:Protein of unknown function (DUF2934)
VDFATRRQKQQELMAGMVERKIRRRARQLYDTRGQVEGFSLQDWFQAESEAIESSILAPVYRKVRVENPQSAQEESEPGNETSA